MASALELVGRCADISAEALEKQYRMEVGYGFFDDVDDLDEDALEDEAFAESELNEVEAAFAEIKNLAKDAQEASAEQDETMETPADKDAGLPDGRKLVELVSSSMHADGEGAKESLHPEKFPHTLSEALGGDRKLWAGLWQLCVALRCGENGMDSKFLRKAEVLRKRSIEMNWHQYL